jgi:GT2 family glycosyltransferase
MGRAEAGKDVCGTGNGVAMKNPKLTVIVVTYNSSGEIEACLRSIRDTIETLSYELILVDNASRDDSVDRSRRCFPGVIIVANEENTGFPAANNQALRRARGEYVLLLNPDTVAHTGAIERLVATLEEHPEVGICGASLRDGEGIQAHDLRQLTFARMAIEICGLDRFSPKFLPPERQEAVSGAAMIFRRSLASEIGLLDEQMFWGEDGDYCLRASQAGYAVWRAQSAVITHFVGRSTIGNLAVYLRKQYTTRMRYIRKHGRPFEFWSMIPLFYLSLIMRTFKWYLYMVFSPSAEVFERLRTYHSLMLGLPSLFVEEARRD